MLSLRQFDSRTTSATYCRSDFSEVRGRERMDAPPVLEFAPRPSDTLPSFIASFSYPVHVDVGFSDTETDSSAVVRENGFK